MKDTHTIWTATQKLDIDNLAGGVKTLNVIDLISDGDEFLQTPCYIENGEIFAYGGTVRYYNADQWLAV